MAGSLPTVPGFRSAIVGCKQSVQQVVSGTGKVQTRVVGAHLTTISLQYPPMKRAEFAPIDSFIMSQRGRDESFTLVMPDKAAPLGAVSGSPVLYADVAAGADTIVLDELVPGTADVFVASDIINFGGYSKVHKVAFSAASPDSPRLLEDGTPRLLEDGSERNMEEHGTVTLTISPPLYKALTKGDAVNYSNVAYTMKYKTDSQEVKITAPRFYAKQIELEEYLSWWLEK